MLSDSVVEPEAARFAVGFAIFCLAVVLFFGFRCGDLHLPTLHGIVEGLRASIGD